jgi:hypothetical protein
MIRLTFAERYQQAHLYAAQVRARKAMGARYAHFKPKPNDRRLISAKLETETSVA